MRSRSSSSAQGRVAKAAGDAFEAWIEAQHEGAKAMGVLLHVVHNEPKTRVVGGRLIYVAKSAADYSGLLVDGTSLCVEAKSTAGRLSRSAIKPKQVEQLDAIESVGDSAYLLVEFRSRKQKFAIPWRCVPWKKLRSAETIGPEDMRAEWLVLPGECYLHRGVLMPAGAGAARGRIFPRE